PTGAVLNTDANFGWNEDTISVGYDEYNEGKFIDFGVGSVTDDTNDRYFGILDGDALIGLFIWDIDDVSGSGSGSGGRPSSGSETGPMSTIATVNEMLKDGSVIVTGDWEPEAGTINIPANTTLYIDGNFDASRVTINGTSATTSKVIVDGKLTIAPSSAKTVNSNIQADSALLDCGSGTLTVRGTLLVDNDLHVKGTSNAINLDGTVTVTGKIIGDEPSSNTTVNANGTVSAAGVEGKVTINVFSTESLHISGTVASSVTIVVGDGSSASNNGYATIGTLEGTLQNKNVNEVAAKTPTVEVVAAGAVVKVEQTGANVTITGTLATDQVVIVAGGKVTLQAGTTIEDDAEDLLVDTETGAPVTGTGNSNLVIAPATDVDTTEGGTIEVETPEDAVTADAATAEVFFVYSAATWELAKEKGVPASFMGGDGSFNANAASEPWLVVKITPAGTASGAVTDLAFTGPNGTITHQLDNTTGTISVTEGTAKILAVDLRIPDGKWNGVQAKDYLKQEKAVKGDYSVSFTFNEKTITSEPAAYDGPEAALAAGDVGYIGASEKNIHPYPADEAAVKTLYSGAPFVDYVAATVSTGLSQSYNNGTIALSGAVKDLSAVEANNANLISAMKFFSNETAGASVEAFTTRYAIENGTKWGFVAIAIESGINWILIVNSGDGWMIVADDADGQPQRHSSLTWNLKIGSETKEYTVDVSGLK
ncbi:MAG: hypothetical protein HFF50_09450, partial [Lawsonibacter sp.]|nr:hypothetical protein [Lawsonibacter sp.]